jgi:hypothetical protein
VPINRFTDQVMTETKISNYQPIDIEAYILAACDWDDPDDVTPAKYDGAPIPDPMADVFASLGL